MNHSFWEKNLEMLKQHQPNLASRVGLKSSQLLSRLFEETVGTKVYFDWADDTGVYHYEKKPAYHYHLKTLDQSVLNPKFIIFMGMGLGQHIVDFFSDSRSSLAEKIIIIEKDINLFELSLHLCDWSHILGDKRVVFYIDIKQEDLGRVFVDHFFSQTDSLALLKTLIIITDTSGSPTDTVYYSECLNAVNRAAELATVSITGPPEDCFRGFMNLVKNLEEGRHVPLFDSLKDIFKGKPGIAVSTGPSLSFSFDWLKNVKDDAVIVSTDSALKLLEREGIATHMASCLERVPETINLFKGLKDPTPTYLVTSPVIWPETYISYPGPKLHFMRPLGQLKWFYPQAQSVDYGNSASHMAYMMLVWMGCSPIYIVGQDLAFDRHSNKTHADGVPQALYDANQKLRKQSEEIKNAFGTYNHGQVEGNDGKPIGTMPVFNLFRQVLEMLVSRHGIKTYNVIPRDYGAKIKHVEWMDPSSIVWKPAEKLNVMATIKSAIKKNADEALAETSRRFELALESLDTYKTVSLKILNAVSEFEQEFNPAYHTEDDYKPLFGRIQAIVNTIFGSSNEFYGDFFASQIQYVTLGICQDAETLANESAEGPSVDKVGLQLKCVKDWFDAVYYWSSKMLEFMREHGPQS